MSGNSEELKACPFCGAEQGRKNGGPKLMQSDSRMGWTVRCTACLARGQNVFEQSAAIAAWNTRPTPKEGIAPASGEVERMVEALSGEFERQSGIGAGDADLERDTGLLILRMDLDVGSLARAALSTLPAQSPDAELIEALEQVKDAALHSPVGEMRQQIVAIVHNATRLKDRQGGGE
jgi:hypothetical protein